MVLHRLSLARAAASVALAVFIVVALLAAPALLPARPWSGDPSLNTVICAAAGQQDCPVAVPDGSGGTIVAWQDRRGPDWDIYVQRVDSDGAVRWPPNGVPISTAVSDQTLPAAVSDGHGGTIVAWQDRRGPDWDIYAQRVDASGALQWKDKGAAVCTTPGDQLSPTVVSDGAGGAIVLWEDRRGGDGSDIYAQRMAAAGTACWAAGGAPVCAAASDQTALSAVSDSAGGAIVTWQDARNGGGYDLYAQRVSSSSATLWAEKGTAVCALAGHQISPVMVADSCGGAIIAWPDARSGTGYDVYGQRVDPEGMAQWTPDGIPICTAAGDQTSLVAASDSCGGAIIAWQDARNGDGYDIYCQRMGPEGSRQWTATGVPVCRAPEDQVSPEMVSNTLNGAIVVWQDRRSGSDYDVYSQSINAAGSMVWSADAVPVCTAAGDQESVTVSAAGGSAIVAWQDARGLSEDIYIQRVQDTGMLGLPPDQPANTSPADGGQEVSLTPTLQCSAFSPGQAADTHAASQWRMTALPGDYSSPVFDSGPDSLALLQKVPGPVALDGNTTYFWQVRHQSSNGLWSAWSAETSFTTLNRPPDRPAGASPSAGTGGVGLAPRLEASSYSDPDGADLQSASQWQISTQPGDYTSPVFDNARLEGPPLTGIVVTPRLDPGTIYYWRVRYRDSHGAWSEWSEESSFTTQAAEEASPGDRMSTASWVYVAGIALAVFLAVAAVLWQNARSSRLPPQPGP